MMCSFAFVYFFFYSLNKKIGGKISCFSIQTIVFSQDGTLTFDPDL